MKISRNIFILLTDPPRGIPISPQTSKCSLFKAEVYQDSASLSHVASSCRSAADFSRFVFRSARLAAIASGVSLTRLTQLLLLPFDLIAHLLVLFRGHPAEAWRRTEHFDFTSDSQTDLGHSMELPPARPLYGAAGRSDQGGRRVYLSVPGGNRFRLFPSPSVHRPNSQSGRLSCAVRNLLHLNRFFHVGNASPRPAVCEG